MKKLALIAATLSLAACASLVPKPVKSPLAQWSASPNFDQRRAQIIVLHYTQQGSVAESLETLKTANSQGKVSSHYLVGRDGSVHQLVGDDARAWHAGGGRWGGIVDLNSASIGIEIDNNGSEPYSEVQIAALIALLQDLTTRLRIPPTQIIGHSDLAPVRKVDPGAHFPWQRLAEAGFGIWPAETAGEVPPGFDPWLAMAAIGYPLEDRAAALRAFRMRFRAIPAEAAMHEPMGEADIRILYALSRRLTD